MNSELYNNQFPQSALKGLTPAQTVLGTGEGWQTRVDGALKEWLKTHTPM